MLHNKDFLYASYQGLLLECACHFWRDPRNKEHLSKVAFHCRFSRRDKIQNSEESIADLRKLVRVQFTIRAGRNLEPHPSLRSGDVMVWPERERQRGFGTIVWGPTKENRTL